MKLDPKAEGKRCEIGKLSDGDTGELLIKGWWEEEVTATKRSGV